LTIFSK